MGTKRELAGLVQEAVQLARPGIFLDAFSGMCSVGERIGVSRPIWSNDVQLFASEVARAIFMSQEAPLSSLFAADLLFPAFQLHAAKLRAVLEQTLASEVALTSGFHSGTTAEYKRVSDLLLREGAHLQRVRYSVFTRLYGNSYIGVEQAIQMDAIISSLQQGFSLGLLSSDQRRWLLLALGRATLKCSASTGHFAQFMTPKSTSRFFFEQRAKSLWLNWLDSIELLSCVGDCEWRQDNRAFNEDSLSLLKTFRGEQQKPAVVYADPPYTDDQYSRYYHLLETIILYDDPAVSGKGRYRSGRFSTPFSLKSRVREAFEELASGVAVLGADLVLSYPSNGLLYGTGVTPEAILAKHYLKIDKVLSSAHSHSTMGASKGSARDSVTEYVYLARS